VGQNANRELMEAAKSGNLDEVRRLVDADPPTIEALLAAGADRAAPNAHGEPPIASAGRHRRPQEVLRLFK
jgi:hypothetical protein